MEILEGKLIDETRCRPISVKMFGKQHVLIESFPKILATDLMTLVECIRRQRPFKLSHDRIQNVEIALSLQSISLHTIKAQIDDLRKNSADLFDANAYYDETRVTAYTNEFQEVQFKHTARCIYLLPDLSNCLVLDLGCGSGLSTERLSKSASSSFIVGMDASQAMLQSAIAKQRTMEQSYVADFVLADFNARLPFRKGVFDHASSTSAVHYVRPTRREEFLNEVSNTVIGDSAFQLFPKDGTDELQTFRSNSTNYQSCIVIDKPHHKDERYYLLFTRRNEVIANNYCPCKLFNNESSLDDPNSRRCLLSFPKKDNIIEKDHIEWLQREHERWFRREERLQRRAEIVDENRRYEPEKSQKLNHDSI